MSRKDKASVTVASMIGRHRFAAALALVGLGLCVEAIAEELQPASAAESDAADATVLPPEVREIQRRLGGSLVDGFSELQPPGRRRLWWQQFSSSPARDDHASSRGGGEFAVERRRSPSAARRIRSFDFAVVPATAVHAEPAEQRVAIHALRDAAAGLDRMANRLEVLEIYPRADALRQFAQQLRLDARELTRGEAPDAVAPTLLDPAGVSNAGDWEPDAPTGTTGRPLLWPVQPTPAPTADPSAD